MNKSKIIPTIKQWLLMISMSLGIGGYFLILSLNLGQETNHHHPWYLDGHDIP